MPLQYVASCELFIIFQKMVFHLRKFLFWILYSKPSLTSKFLLLQHNKRNPQPLQQRNRMINSPRSLCYGCDPQSVFYNHCPMQGQHGGQTEPVLLGQKQIMQMVKQYLGSVLFRNAHQYEAVTSNHAKYLEFTMQKVELAEEGPFQYEDITVQSLLLGSNQGRWLNLQLLRTVQYGHVLLSLAIDEIEPYAHHRHTVLAIIFNSRQSARLWAQKYSFLTILRVKDPHKSIHKAYGSLPLVLTRPENILIKRSYRLHPQYPQTFKNEGNCKFKERNFEQALLSYQIGIGLLLQSDKKRDRAVLYANSSHCLYGMKLYQSALIYAETSIALDKNYIKGFFRKLNCLLQLDLKEVPRVLCSIDTLAPAQSEEAVEKYTRYMTNSSGMFNWREMLTSDSPVFGEYVLNKITLKQTGKEQYSFRADKLIHQHELIIVHKPLIAKKSYEQRFGEQYTRLTQQIEVFSRYQQLFYRRFSCLPYQKTLQGQPLTFESSNSSQSLQINQIHAKCLRCLELEKTIQIVNTSARTQILGIWEKLYAFRHECLANCNYIHIKGALVVFALRDIKPDQYLSLDFLNWETTNRKQFMLQKLSKTCDCSFCQIDWAGLQRSLPLQIYKLLQQTHDSQACPKVSLFIMWNLIFQKQIAEVQLMREYLILLERYPLWQCVMNCLRYLRTKSKNDLFDLIKSTLKRILQKYFKINHQQAVDLLKSLI